jgi:radical SAM protein with 4Fe4S-binding SPASM domain
MANGEGRMGQSFDGYIDGCIAAAEALGRHGVIAALRLWNEDNPEAVGKAQNGRNGEVLAKLRTRFPDPWTPNRRGYKLGEGVYLEWGELFDWPTTDGSLPDYGPRSHCFAMKDHVAVLCDGRVLPCCIDCDGVMPLGNLNDKSLSDILTDAPAQDFLRSLTANHLNYPLCRHCNFK